jgi:DNA-binding beta-propeller fold protein YncE
VDDSGSLWIADSLNNRVRVVGRDGFIRTAAGSANTDDLWVPFAIAFDPVGNALITDLRNRRIRRLEANGSLSTIAGTGTPGFSGDGGPATAALLYTPSGISVDRFGNVFFADYANHRIRRLSPDGLRIASGGIVGESLSVRANLTRPDFFDLWRAVRLSPDSPSTLGRRPILRSGG